MTLLRLNEFDPHHRRTVKGKDVRQFQIYSNQNHSVGRVVDALLDDAGQFHYLIADLKSPTLSRQVLIPLRQTQIDLQTERVYLSGLNDAQIAEFPAYNTSDVDPYLVEAMGVSQPDSIRSTTQSALILEDSTSLEASLPLESVTPLEAQVVKLVQPATTSTVHQTASIAPSTPNSSSSQTTMHGSSANMEPTKVPQATPPSATSSIRHTSSEVVDEKTIQLLEERLFVDRHKRKVGEVIVRKEIVTQIVEIPIRREMLIVEQISPEHQQLASIDLTGGTLDGVELAQLGGALRSQHSDYADSTAQLPGDNGEVMSSEFSSVEAAIEFLRAIAAQPGANSRQVQIHLITPNR